MHQLGINQAESIIDKRIWYGGNVYNIIGVIKDYNQESLRSNFDPYLFRLMPNARSFYSLAINPKNSIQLIEEIDEVWKKHFPGLPFEYFFAENYYNEQYKAEDQFGIIFLIFSILAIIIASLGLYGLASYSASQRTKEIGIRKVLGASSSLIIKIFIVDYLKLLSIAIFIGLPICFYILNRWLLGFANHISIKWWLLALPAIIVAVIVLITISSNALKSAIRNPIESINYE